MPNPKCNVCGMVNFADAQTCKRCETTLSGNNVAQPPKVRLKPTTINGMGVDLLGYRKLSADTYQVTRFFTFLYIPLIPISTWVIRPLNRELSTFTTSERFNFELLEDKGLIVEDVLRVYGGFLFWGVLAFGPFALLLMLMSGEKVERDIYGERMIVELSTAKIIKLSLFVLSMPWCICLPLWLKRRRDKIYTLTKKNWFARLLGVR